MTSFCFSGRVFTETGDCFGDECLPVAKSDGILQGDPRTVPERKVGNWQIK